MTDAACLDVDVVTRRPTAAQERFRSSRAKRKVIRAGRRGGKTTGIAILSVDSFCDGHRVLYTAPTAEQTDAFWYEVKRALLPLVDTGVYKLNESERYIERIGTKNRIKAKTAWDANTLRGDYADLLIFDEYQLTNEDAWGVVGAPMLMDNNGDAVFIYTPPSLLATGVSKARDPRHAAKLFKEAQKRHDAGESWETFHFTSYDNPHISQEAIGEIAKDMSKATFRQEIMAEDDEMQLSWLVYKAFNEGVCKVKRFEIPQNWLVGSGHDFGGANPAALFFAQVKLPLPPGTPPYMRLNDWVAFREYLPGGGSAPVHVGVWREILGGRTLGWAVGGNVTTEEEIRQLYRMHGWPIQAPKITRVKAQLERVIGLMELNKLYVFDDLVHYQSELMNCLWKLDNEGKPTDEIKDESNYHLCACARASLSGLTPETAVRADYSRTASNNH